MNLIFLSLYHLLSKIIYFPFWWYTKGINLMWQYYAGSIRSFEKTLGLILWIKNWFSPMYGVRDVWGRIISFIMRSIILFFRLIAFFIIFIVYTFIFVLYILSVPISLTFLIYNFL